MSENDEEGSRKLRRAEVAYAFRQVMINATGTFLGGVMLGIGAWAAGLLGELSWAGVRPFAFVAFALIVFGLSFTWLIRQPTATDEERLAMLQARVDVAKSRAEYEIPKREERIQKASSNGFWTREP